MTGILLQKIFIVLYAIITLVYFYEHNWWMAIYWFGVLLVTLAITILQGGIKCPV